ncbi:MAG: (2Fe-2S)-binding protein [Chloroflexota bacterium]|jgi:isoquinoline 1-oxidoreductase alpha subunit|nr:(2Fe-2S)-binding protein [Chloroflexota bacterium]
MPSVRLNINGEDQVVDAPAGMPLLWVLRDFLGLTGTKYGCGIGVCGSCTVHVAGRAVRSCSIAVEKVTGPVTTIEGLSANGDHPVQLAWLAENVSQCGYCQPGQVMTAAALLAAHPRPDDAAIDAAMSGVLCRCGTYQRIRLAIQRAADRP